MSTVDELRPLTARELLELWRESGEATQEPLERALLCNARVLAACCYRGGERAFSDEREVLSAMTGRDLGPECAFLGSCALYGNTYFDDISADAYLDALEAAGVTTVYAAAGTGAKLYRYRSGRGIRMVEAANLSVLLEAAYSLPAALRRMEKEE